MAALQQHMCDKFMSVTELLAIDLGAESGRVMRASFDGARIALDEVHRFPNVPVRAGGTLYWDVLRLWHEIQTGISKAGDDIVSLGVDTWGVDVALLDRNGQLIANPYHYRDSRTDGAMDWVFDRMPRREIFERTGIQFIQLNGIYQLAAMVRDNSSLLDGAHTLLTIADLFNYWLSGSKTCEFTEATTLQLVNPRQNDWDRDIFEAIGISTDILTPIVQPGTRIGEYDGTPVIASVCHDTGSAVVGVPTTTKKYAYLSSGTWSLLGLELDRPIISDATYDANLTNEGGYDGTYRLLKNIMGLWLAQQSRSTWQQEGRSYSYDDLVKLAESATAFTAFVEPDDARFFPPGDIPARVRDYCRETGQPVPQDDAHVMRVIYESLAMKYRKVLDDLIDVSGHEVDVMHVIGGGSQNGLLCQMTANAIGRPVIAGPREATALGNSVVQFIAHGELSSVAEARTMLSESVGTVTYEPQNVAGWNEQYQRYLNICY